MNTNEVKGDEDGLVWYGASGGSAWCRKKGSAGPGAWADCNGKVEPEVERVARRNAVDFTAPRPDWITPAQIAEIKRLLGVEATTQPLPWDKPDQLRTVDGRRIHNTRCGLTGDWMFDVGDNNPGPCLCDDLGRLRGTSIPIIRLATAAELEAEKPKSPTPDAHLELSNHAAKCVVVHFPGMKFDRTEGDDAAVFVRVEGGGE